MEKRICNHCYRENEPWDSYCKDCHFPFPPEDRIIREPGMPLWVLILVGIMGLLGLLSIIFKP